MTYEEALNFITGLINYEKKFAQYNEENYNPEKISYALKSENISLKAKIFHIAGTKGKGSTSIYLAELIYRHSGENTALYTSPHIDKINERIVVNGVAITDDEFAQLITEYKDKFTIYGFTFFEALTFIAMVYFERKECKYIVLETGLGGRLDATNFCKPVLSIITPISFDHTDILGKTLSKIAYEKAGIIKENIPVLSAKQRFQALRTLKEVAFKKNSLFFYLPEIVNYRIDRKNKIVDINFKDISFNDLKFYLPSDVFIDNFILSLTAFKLYFNQLDSKIIEDVLKIDLPFRMKLKGNFLFDVAHNDDSIEKLFKNIKAYGVGGEKKILIFGILADKELKRIAKVIKKYRKMFEKIVLFDFEAIRNSGSKELFNLLKPIKNVEYVKDLKHVNFDEKSFYVVTGSFYIMKYVEILTQKFRK